MNRPGELSRRLAAVDARLRAEREERSERAEQWAAWEARRRHMPASWWDVGAGLLGGLIVACIIVAGVGLLLIG